MPLVCFSRLASSLLSEIMPLCRPFWRSIIYVRSISNPHIDRKARILRSSVRGLNKLGSNSIVSDSSICGSVSIGHNSKVLEASLVGSINIGNFTTVNGPSTVIYSELNTISIGSFTSIAPNCSIYEVNHHSSRLSTYNVNKNLFHAVPSLPALPIFCDSQSKGPIVIGSDVWIGAKTVVLSGITIGDGAIIGANSTVTSKVPPYSISVGSPARVISYRFDPLIIERLLAVKWWDWDVQKILSNRGLFTGEVSLEALDAIR